MKPLSSLKFFMKNKKRSATILIILFLSVAVISFITSIVTSIIEDAAKGNLSSYKAISVISPVSNDMFLKNEVVEQVAGFPEIEHIFNVNMSYTQITLTMGNTSSIVFYPDHPEDITTLMKTMGLELTEGRLPVGEDFEIIMHERLLQNKNLSVGDYIGNDIDENEWLPGKSKIVGSLKGEAIISFANKSSRMEALKNSGIIIDKPIVQVLVPKEGQLSQLNKRIENLDKRQVSFTTYDSIKRSFDLQADSMNTLLSIIIFVVVFIVSISISALIYIVYMDRSDEFGILHAMGYRKSFIKKLIFKELIALSVVSWIGGYFFSWVVFGFINYFIMDAKGQTLYFFTSYGLINTLIIPFMVIICATFPIIRKFKKWDPISVIERRD